MFCLKESDTEETLHHRRCLPLGPEHCHKVHPVLPALGSSLCPPALQGHEDGAGCWRLFKPGENPQEEEGRWGLTLGRSGRGLPLPAMIISELQVGNTGSKMNEESNSVELVTGIGEEQGRQVRVLQSAHQIHMQILMLALYSINSLRGWRCVDLKLCSFMNHLRGIILASFNQTLTICLCSLLSVFVGCSSVSVLTIDCEKAEFPWALLSSVFSLAGEIPVCSSSRATFFYGSHLPPCQADKGGLPSPYSSQSTKARSSCKWMLIVISILSTALQARVHLLRMLSVKQTTVTCNITWVNETRTLCSSEEFGYYYCIKLC